MRVEIYVRPIEVPHTNFEESDVRIYYNGQWVGFRKGEVTITKDESAMELNERGECIFNTTAKHPITSAFSGSEKASDH